jgi:hypothetical protein
MKTTNLLCAVAFAAQLSVAAPVLAKAGDPVKVGDDLTVDPIIDARLRYEGVDQPATKADAVTMRIRAGAEVKKGKLGVLVEAEGTLAIINDYNAFPFANPSEQRRPQYSTVADPMNVELNRVQLQYTGKAATLTIGRQRINIDDQRWVGAGGWRQNEQTFDAARVEAKIGPVSLDGTYATSQRTIYGIDAGPRQSFDGDFIFGNAVLKTGPVTARAFVYSLDYDESVVFANSSLTYGGKVVAAFPVGDKTALNLTGSYAHQTDQGDNPVHYGADYYAVEGALALHELMLTAGYETLGSDGKAAGGVGRALQTPLATLHRFNGWADVFLTTPNTGLRDLYFGAAYKFKSPPIPGLNAALTWHRFDSDRGDIRYGTEWDSSIGFKLGRYAILGKYANYDAKAFGVDTEKIWLQVEVGY